LNIEIEPHFPYPCAVKWFTLLMAVAAGFLAGCSKSAPPPPPVPVAATRPGMPPLPTKAQPKLKTIRLWLGPEELNVELALTQEQTETGMMFRTNLDENAGMFFVFKRPWQASFWMMHCPLPLTAAYIAPDGTLLEIHDLHSQDTNSVVAVSSNIQYVLEVNEGWFKRHHIDTNTMVRTEFGSLPESFARRP
jgi:uncharacterized protein